MTRAGIYYALFLFLYLFSYAGLQAQTAVHRDTVYFTSNRKSIHIPFKLVHNLVIIPLRINGSGELNFILDSGVKSTLITRLYFNDSLSLNSASKITVQGLGIGYKIEALASNGNNLYMRGIQGDNQQVFVLLEDVFNLSTRMGMPVHGIIGYDIFKNFIVKIDYSKKVLTLYRPDAVVKTKKGSETYPLHIEENKPYIFANIRQHNGDTVKVKLVVDTGASHTLSLYLPTDDRLMLPPKVMEAYLGRGLSGDVNGKIGRLDGFSLGKYELHNLPASYPNEASIKTALNVANRNGNLGSDILNRFTVIFDYPHSRMTLLPNRKYKQPFHFNMSGFEVSTPLPGTNFYIVSYVVEGSPATIVGLKPGDQLVTINGRDCKDLDLNGLLEIMEGRPGQKLRMQLRRDSKLIQVDIVLESRI
jgi:hypothetical protein